MRRLFFFLLCLPILACAHEGHHEDSVSWVERIGSLHLILLHFPIALINMLVVSEALWIWLKKPIYEYASRFLVVSAAVISAPTAIFGFIYSYSTSYEGILATFFWWHMLLGIATSIGAIDLVFMKGKRYYWGLLLLFLLVNTASFFGGALTFSYLIVGSPIS